MHRTELETETMMRKRPQTSGGLAMWVAAMVLVGTPAAIAQIQAPTPLAADRDRPLPPDTDEQRIADLVISNHILADQGVLDGFGHISVRSAKNPKHYYMSRSRAPGIVTKEDILEFDDNSVPIDQKGRELYSERFIHGELFRARPDVQSVVHSHSYAILPYSVTNAPLKAMIHVANFLGTEPAPVFDLAKVGGADNRMLVQNAPQGNALAKALGTRSVVLLRGHGMAVVGSSIRDSVFKAIYTQINAQTETKALRLNKKVEFLNQFEVLRVGQTARQWELWVTTLERKGSQ